MNKILVQEQSDGDSQKAFLGQKMKYSEIIDSSVDTCIKYVRINTCHIHVAGHATKKEGCRDINDNITLKSEDNVYCVH
jgi:hypothetical protein